MWRWIIVIVIIVVVVAGLYAATRAAEPVDTAVVARAGIAAYVEERARTRLPRTYRITMPIDGRILPIDLVEGSPVRVGETIARMDTADLETAVAAARAHVEQLRARILENNDTRLESSTLVQLASFLESVDRSVEAAEAKTEASRARERYHTTDVERRRTAYERDSLSRAELEEAELSEIQSRVDYRTDVLELRGIEAVRKAVQIWPLQVRQVIEKKALTEAALTQQLAEAQVRLEQAERDLKRAAVRSPVDGTVLRRAVSSREMLPAGSLLLELGRLEELEIEIEVLSQDAVHVSERDPVDVVLPATGEVVAGVVKRIEPRGFTKISSLGVEQQRVLVIAGFDPDGLAALRAGGRALGVGYRVRVRIYTDARDDAVVIPRTALFRGAGERWETLVVRNGRARLREVRIGLVNDREAEVLEGLEPGEEIIIAPDTAIVDGTRVRVRS